MSSSRIYSWIERPHFEEIAAAARQANLSTAEAGRLLALVRDVDESRQQLREVQARVRSVALLRAFAGTDDVLQRVSEILVIVLGPLSVATTMPA